jgi:hypothetical protein
MRGQLQAAQKAANQMSNGELQRNEFRSKTRSMVPIASCTELLCGTYPRRLCGAHCLLERRLPPHRGKSFDVCTGVLPPAYLLYPGEAPSQYRGTLKERCILLGYEIHQCHLAVVGVLSIPPLHKE